MAASRAVSIAATIANRSGSSAHVSVIGVATVPIGYRSSARTSQSVPLRRPTLRAPKVHPGTGLPLNKAKGQHIMHNVGVLQKMLEVSDLRSYDSVYEVGCGTGELTIRLLPLVRKVNTIDVEQRMVQETEHRAEAFGYANLETAVGDALKVPLPPRFDVCVSNLPYQISSPMIFRLLRRLSDGPPWRAAVLMLQREYAERLLADPGEKNFSRLALSVRLFARVKRCFDVAPGSFVPQPQVHSTVVRLEPRLPAPKVDFLEWDALIRLIFSRRRKTLRSQFKRISVISMLEHNYKIRCSLMGEKPATCPFPDLVFSVLEQQGMMRERAFLMDINDLHSLLLAFNRAGIHFVNVQGNVGSGRQRSDMSMWHEDDVEEEEAATSNAEFAAALDELGPLAMLHGQAGGKTSTSSFSPRAPVLPPPPPQRSPPSDQSSTERPLTSQPSPPPPLAYP
eukprot:TRINITY_DN61349_c0_g1_i1.p1 TRINITY_DN61349_c0_g1~~TRINITY_DN61349_c0_g1_i1.p1  ORF type:complete len:471 (-),score=65.72 TRINITY_DN61349_c0_g1_i1:238-1593(-)